MPACGGGAGATLKSELEREMEVRNSYWNPTTTTINKSHKKRLQGKLLQTGKKKQRKRGNGRLRGGGNR